MSDLTEDSFFKLKPVKFKLRIPSFEVEDFLYKRKEAIHGLRRFLSLQGEPPHEGEILWKVS